jgi:cyclopropane-fatty-acyl-phospholipid synthase
LNPNGRMLLQAIVMPEQRYSRYLNSVDFIQKYIFPGGCLPSVTAMQNSMTRNSRLRLLSMVDFADGYARTLREWRRSFLERREDVRQLGYSERFIRMWDYYLTYCEGAFEERAVGVVQAVWGR